MTELKEFFNPINNESDEFRFEVIESATLKSREFEGLSVSGSLFSLTTFVNVTFRSCVFFGTHMENCEFINCNFIDCSFKFSRITHCKFQGVTFKSCTWDFTHVKKATLNFCHLDAKTAYQLSKEDNDLAASFAPNRDLSWEDVAIMDEFEASKDEAQTMTVTIMNFLRKIA